MAEMAIRLPIVSSSAALAAALTIMSAPASAQETTTYTYDALGRLNGSTISGGSNSNRGTSSCYDAAGNRTRYVVGAAGASCTAPPPVTPTNTAPVCSYKAINSGIPAIAGPVTVQINPITQYPPCTDADGDTLTLVSATGFTNGASGTISGNVITITGIRSGGGTTFSYTVTDGKGGYATATFQFLRS